MNRHSRKHSVTSILSNQYPAACAASMLYPALRIVMLLFPAWLAAVCIAAGRMTPLSLLLGRTGIWLLFAVFWSLLRFLLLTPVRCGTYSWFMHLTSLQEKGQPKLFFRSFRDYHRCICFFAGFCLLRFAVLLPFAAACAAAVLCTGRSIAFPDDGTWLFLALQAAAAAVWALLYYVHFLLRTAAVPYLFLADPTRSVFTAVRISFHDMSGCTGRLIWLWLRYLPAMLPVITIPFLLPYLYTEITLLIRLRILKSEQERKKYGADISHGPRCPVFRRRISAP